MNGNQHPQQQRQNQRSPMHSWKALSRWVFSTPWHLLAVFVGGGLLFWLGIPQGIWGSITSGLTQMIGASITILILLAIGSMAIRGWKR